jgi:hypothetical protein
MLLSMGQMMGCSSDNEEDLMPSPQQPADCPTAQVTYALAVKPILQQRCYSCHAGGMQEGNVRLEEHAQVRQHATSGLLMGVINHSPGFKQMPFNSPKLPACDIAKIKAWVDAGAPNN